MIARYDVPIFSGYGIKAIELATVLLRRTLRKDMCNDHPTSTLIVCGICMRHCSPTFNESSDNQTVAKWPAPNDISEAKATETCRAIILNETFIGQQCVERLGNEKSSADIIQACIDDVQVLATTFTCSNNNNCYRACK